MASQTEILDALVDYAARCNANPRLRRMLQGWTRLVHFSALDTDQLFTVRIDDGEIVGLSPARPASLTWSCRRPARTCATSSSTRGRSGSS